jgi:hypothetical protein
MVVDGSQSDDLGLPLVRGPFRSLTAARQAIADALARGPSVSPLAEVVKASKARPSARSSKRDRSQPARPEPPKQRESAWLAGLDPAKRHQADRLLRRLERAGATDAEAVARSELVDGRPAVAQFALERRIAAIVASAKDTDTLIRDIVACIVSGQDATLEVGWKVTDEQGRPIHRPALPEGEGGRRGSR